MSWKPYATLTSSLANRSATCSTVSAIVASSAFAQRCSGETGPPSRERAPARQVLRSLESEAHAIRELLLSRSNFAADATHAVNSAAHLRFDRRSNLDLRCRNRSARYPAAASWIRNWPAPRACSVSCCRRSCRTIPPSSSARIATRAFTPAETTDDGRCARPIAWSLCPVDWKAESLRCPKAMGD